MKPLALILAFVIGISVSAFGQQRGFLKPDYDAIKKATHDKSSAYYYPPLFERYKNNDTTLGIDEFKYLYYGYFFNKPHAESSFSDKDVEKNKEINELLGKEKLSNEDIAKLSSLCLEYLDTNPFDLRRLNLVYSTKKKLGDTAAASKYHYKTGTLIRTILNSGDGKTDETGFHVLDVSHEYFMLNVFGYESTGQSITPHPCDYLSLKSNPDNVKGIYFDVSQIFNGYNEMFKGVGEDFIKDIDRKKKKKR